MYSGNSNNRAPTPIRYSGADNGWNTDSTAPPSCSDNAVPACSQPTYSDARKDAAINPTIGLVAFVHSLITRTRSVCTQGGRPNHRGVESKLSNRNSRSVPTTRTSALASPARHFNPFSARWFGSPVSATTSVAEIHRWEFCSPASASRIT